MKAIFKEYDYGTKIILLILLAVFCAIVLIGVSVGIISIFQGISFNEALIASNNINQIGSLRFFIFSQQLGMFIVPALLFTFLTVSIRLTFLRLNTLPNLGSFPLIVLLVLILLPFINWTGAINESMHLPDILIPLEEALRNMEKSANEMIIAILGGEGVSDLLVNIFLIALVPAIGEELFFRGSMQNVFSKWFKNKHWAIWLTAFIFSAWHFQFFSFLPRFFLGALLGYLFFWS